MRVLIDMNLSPTWVGALARPGWTVRHWTEVGSSDADDSEIAEWARANSYVILTQDLDFGTLVVLAGVNSPSIVQIRAQDVAPLSLAPVIAEALRQHESDLTAGALIVVYPDRLRVRLLRLTSS